MVPFWHHRPWRQRTLQRGALNLGFYRAFDSTVAQNQQRMNDRLTMPVLAIGGERSYGAHVADAMNAIAEDVEGVVIPGAGNWVAEEAPEELLAALTPFLTAARRDDSTFIDTSRAVGAV